ncbi:MAG: NAD(P)/FAD-dependent oxidoreductase [Bacteroidales bacterium]|nr:NAD(P)/FAD-dependent oxidoreductase [Bacteroidales bacterium]
MLKKKIIIIGGGVAGLSAGIYGQMFGFETLIFEMHNVPGGQCTAWDRNGYRFDYCLHWLIGTRTSAFHDIWKETNVINDNVVIVDNEIHTVYIDDTWGEFIIYNNVDKWQEYLTSKAPEDALAIRNMCDHMRMGAGFEPFFKAPSLRSFLDYVRVLLTKTKLLFMLNRYSKMPAKTYFNKLKFKSPWLRFFLHKLFGETNFSALIVIMMLGWFHLKNAGYLVGGSLPLALRMADRYRDLGGKLQLGKKVEKILVEKNRATGIQLTDGTVYHADYIISAADGHATLFDMLEGKYLTPELRRAYSTWDLYDPFVQVAFGVNDRIRSKAVTTAYIKDIFTIGNLEIRHGYSIMNQSMNDPTLAPEGKTSLVLRFDSAWEDWENIGAEDYKRLKDLFKDKGIKLLEKHYPGITCNIEVIDVATPKTNVKYTGVWKGAYEGFLPTGNMVKKTLKPTIPGLKSFYMIGQWMFPGGGLPPAAQSGQWVMQMICRNRKNT